jgi:cation diffusion facilitator CzcD-associated flavoprotein CzcO
LNGNQQLLTDVQQRPTVIGVTTATQPAGTTTSPTDRPTDVGVLVIGSGFSGLAAAIKMAEQGRTDFVVIERGADVGGTWRDNTYPGAACDVPSHLYSYSFELNPGWTRSFSQQGEIQTYLQGVAHKHGVLDRHRFSTEVTSARWDEATGTWDVQTTGGAYRARVVISAVGALCEPRLPDIPGIESFGGTVFHSARWDHDAELAGARVAVIGTGASAIQIVPAIAEQVERLDVYQRTAPWLLPRNDRAYTALERTAFRRVPGFQRLSRALIYGARELQVLALAKHPELTRLLQLVAAKKIRDEVADPALRAKVTPSWRIGCKRMLISNAWYPALQRPNVELVTDPIAEIRPNAVVTADGTVREVDALVVATGFQVTDSPAYEVITGADGRTLAQTWRESGMQAYKGASVAGFPNLFFLVGPNTGLGHSSMVYMIESQVGYVLDALKTLDERRLATVEVRREAMDTYNAELQRKLARTVWTTGGCGSWYLDAHGNNTTLWPDFTFAFRRATRHFDIDAYRTSPRVAPRTTREGASA